MSQGARVWGGNMGKHETRFNCGINPWGTVGSLDDETLRGRSAKARGLLRASVGKPGPDGVVPRRPTMWVYARPGQPCRRCFTRLRMNRQGVDIRYTTWCPKCQPIVEGQPMPPEGPRRR